MNIFDGIEKLINEHGSATILRERIALASDQYIALEKKNTLLTKENTSLKSENSILKSENQSLKLDNEEQKIQIQNLEKRLKEGGNKSPKSLYY